MPNQYPTGLNGWLYMSRSQYNAITPDAYTKYTVKDGDEVHEYLGDVEITAEDGTAWVTKAFYDVDQQAVRDVIESIYDDVEELKTWRTVTIAPWKADITDRVTALETWKIIVDDFMENLDIESFNTWKANVDTALETISSSITAINTALASLQNSAVTSSDIRVIDVVAEMPASPTATTLYIVEGST